MIENCDERALGDFGTAGLMDRTLVGNFEAILPLQDVSGTSRA